MSLEEKAREIYREITQRIIDPSLITHDLDLNENSNLVHDLPVLFRECSERIAAGDNLSDSYLHRAMIQHYLRERRILTQEPLTSKRFEFFCSILGVVFANAVTHGNPILSSLLYAPVGGTITGIIRKTDEQSEIRYCADDYGIAIQNGYRMYEAFHLRGLLWMRSGNLEGSLADFNQAIVICPDYVVAYLGRAQVFFSTKQYDLAIHDCEKVLRATKKYPLAWELRERSRNALNRACHSKSIPTGA